MNEPGWRESVTPVSHPHLFEVEIAAEVDPSRTLS
jgi:hypothetical protein